MADCIFVYLSPHTKLNNVITLTSDQFSHPPSASWQKTGLYNNILLGDSSLGCKAYRLNAQ
jgi:hypothetical protein